MSGKVEVLDAGEQPVREVLGLTEKSVVQFTLTNGHKVMVRISGDALEIRSVDGKLVLFPVVTNSINIKSVRF